MVEMLLSQTFVGPSPSSLILSYLKHAVMSEVRTTPALQLINLKRNQKKAKISIQIEHTFIAFQNFNESSHAYKIYSERCRIISESLTFLLK